MKIDTENLISTKMVAELAQLPPSNISHLAKNDKLFPEPIHLPQAPNVKLYDATLIYSYFYDRSARLHGRNAAAAEKKTNRNDKEKS